MKVNYSFSAETPLFTGSDEATGITRTLRREKVLLKKHIEIQSSFSTTVERRKALMEIVYHVYANIPIRLKGANYGFYEAYSNKIKTAVGSRSKNQFLNKILTLCSIIVLDEASGKIIKENLDRFSDEEFLETLKEEHAYLMILLREYVQIFKAEKNEIGNIKTEIDKLYPKTSTPVSFTKYFENVPYFGGNSIRGYLRRLVMADFCKQAGITNLEKAIYHQLFTGGAITESAEKLDIAFIDKYIAMCPPIGLLGSAIGNTTIEGELKVIGARLNCSENGTGKLSMWELIQVLFATKHDDSKGGAVVEINDERTEKEKKDAQAIQMYYQTESFVTGAQFSASFVITSEESLLISAFWRMIILWKENNVIGGNSARDYGMIDLKIDIPQNADKEYLDYIEKNKDEIKKYFNVSKAILKSSKS